MCLMVEEAFYNVIHDRFHQILADRAIENVKLRQSFRKLLLNYISTVTSLES